MTGGGLLKASPLNCHGSESLSASQERCSCEVYSWWVDGDLLFLKSIWKAGVVFDKMIIIEKQRKLNMQKTTQYFFR